MITLFQHQQQALDLTEGHNRCAYYLDMGLGKTFVGSEKALTLNSRVNLLICQCSKVSDWIDHMVENYAMNHCWMIYDLTNKKEFDWFMAAVAETDNPTRICGVINYELTFRRKILKTLSGFTLMLDESSLIQNENAKRSKFILGLNPDNVILLSGTPTGGKYEKLWSQCRLLGWNISKELFWKQYIETEWVEEDGFWRQKITGYKNVDRLKKKLAEHGAVFMTTDDAGIDLPKRNFVPVRTPPAKEYWKFWRERAISINTATLQEFELDSDFWGSNESYERELIGDNVTLPTNTLNDNDWATIKQVSDSGKGSSYWAVGDMKSIQINGKVGNFTFSNLTINTFILGFNHNSGKEGNNKIHFQIGKIGTTAVALCDSQYNSNQNNNGYFNMNPNNSNSGGWKESYMRKTLLGNTGTPTSPPSNSLLAALPSALRNVMKPVTKYTDNVGNNTGNTQSNVTSTTDYLFLLAEYEVFGSRSYANSYEQNYQVQYDYYKAGNSKVANNHTSTTSAVWWWLRSPYYGGRGSFCNVSSYGSSTTNGAYYSAGVRPGFAV